MSERHISDAHMAAMHPEPDPPEVPFGDVAPEPPRAVRITAGFIAEYAWPGPYASGFGETEEEARLDLELHVHIRDHRCPAITSCDVAYDIWSRLYALNPARHMPMA